MLVAACGDDSPAPRSAVPAPARVAAADPAEGITTELDGVAPELDVGLLAELTGDTASAASAYEQVLAAPEAPAAVAARAALHLARLEARAGKSRRALELGARAAALAPSDVAIQDGIAQVRADVVAASGTGEVRGPPVGTTLPGVDAKLADAFAAAERALVQVHAQRPRLVIEALSASIRNQEDAYESVAAKYRAIADHGGVAQVACEYRIGSLYQDLGLGLLFEPLPPELDSSVAAGLRRVLRGRALAYLKRAAAAYRTSLAGSPLPDAELWRLAADNDLRGTLDILRAAGEPEAP
ncbi:MAG: hypothetical protein ACM31C_03740 [Acidobacteriota bacterium]